MILEIKCIHSPDLLNIKDFQDNGQPFNVLWQVMIGEKDIEGVECFSFEVCNIEFLNNIIKKDDSIVGHGFLVVDFYDYDCILNKIHQIMYSIHHDTWKEFAISLSKYSLWEFDSCKE